jgi:DNA-directed RNA polymerase subunit H (RpoH/RPB5)
MSKEKEDFNDHLLVPKHSKVSEAEKKELMEKLNVSFSQLPAIYSDDPAIKHLELEKNSLVKITRKSATGGETTFFRRVL